LRPDTTELPTADEAAARRRWIALAVVYLLHSAWLAVVAEDAYITFRFARNLGNGEGLVWNVGAPPVEGFTNLSWTLLAALVEWSGIDVARTMQLLGVAAGLAILWLVDRVAVRVFGLTGWSRTLPVLLLAVSGPLATWSASGLETSLFTLLVLASLYRLSVWLRTARSSDLVAAWAATALGTLTRPEGWLLGLVVGWITLRGAALGRRRPPGWVLPAVYLLMTVALTVWRLVYFGAPLPNTFYAKTGGGGAQALRGAVYLGYFAFHFLLPLVPLAALAASRPSPDGDGVRRLAARALAAWCVLFALYVVVVGGDYMAMYRFFVPLLPPLYLLLARSSQAVLDARARSQPPRRTRRVAALLLVAAVAGTLVHSLPMEADLYDKPRRQHGMWRGVETERWHVRRLERLARFFEQRAGVRRGASVATRAIGVIGYRTRFVVHDFHGLVDPQITDYLHVLELEPTWWMFTRKLRDGPARWPSYDEETDRRLRREYTLVTVEIEDEVNDEEGFFSFLERKDWRRPGRRRELLPARTRPRRSGGS
jgi:hypothetical protein